MASTYLLAASLLLLTLINSTLGAPLDRHQVYPSSTTSAARRPYPVPANTTLPASPANVTTGNTTSIGNTTNTLGFFDWLFNPTAGTVNMFSTRDCLSPCIAGVLSNYCSSPTDAASGDLGSTSWNMDSGLDCFDIPEGTQSIGMAATEGHYVGSSWDCQTRSEAVKKDDWTGMKTFEEISTGEGDASLDQACSAIVNDYYKEMKSIVYVGE